MSDSRRLVLVDGHAVLYRAFFAIKGLSTSGGQATNAVFGFVRMLRQLRETWAPTHWAVFFDGGLPESRLAILEEYKAQRPRMPDELRSQIPLVEEYLDCAGIAWIRRDGEEADDVIASVARRLAGHGDEVLLATGDKDMFQLVGETVRIVPVSGRENKAMGPAEVEEKTGVPPEQIVEWLAMVGDSSDNIPGVPGVGPKTAARLLRDFGSIDAIMERIDEIKREKLRACLLEHRDRMAANVEMVRLRDDLECELDWEDTEVRGADEERLLVFFERLELKSFAQELREKTLF